jgi:tRNA(fMet)-specific endonuclease VapC
MYVLDTNTLIYYFKGQGNVAQFMSATAPQDIVIPTIVLFELQMGIEKSTSPEKRILQLQQLLDRVNLVPFDQDAALAAAKIRVHLERQGQPIGPMDTLIAAVAVSRQSTLVTRNIKEFSRVPDLAIVNWY